MAPTDADALWAGRQGRGEEKWRCTWKSSGIRTVEDPYYEEAIGLGRLRRCEPRAKRKVFDVWLSVRQVVHDKPDPLVARRHYTIAVRRNGRLRESCPSCSGTTSQMQLGVSIGLCWADWKVVVPPEETPLYTVLFVKRRGSEGTLRVESRPWSDEACSAPQL